MRYLDCVAYLPDDILTKVDRASMAVALEARVPLLDRRVAEFAWTLPRRFLVRDGVAKWLLKEVLARHLPRPLWQRPKQGFAVPLARWLREPLAGWAQNLLHASDAGGGFLDATLARRKLAEHQSGARNHAYGLWAILMFESWRRRWA
jgi:asparagine synthase (glutamine-hydrolysing)